MSYSTLIQSRAPATIGSSRREASLNWLALGLLLAAWNAARDDAANPPYGESARPRRPEILRGYSSVSVRAVHRVTSQAR